MTSLSPARRRWDAFPEQLAATRRFTLGLPRAFTVTPSGRMRFLRTRSGRDPVTCLWELDLHDDPASGEERCLIDPARLPAPPGISAAERAHRERMREQAGGITSYASSSDSELVAFTVGGALYTYRTGRSDPVHHPLAGAVFDPRPSPAGDRVAYVRDDGLDVLELPGGDERPGMTRSVIAEAGVRWGVAEFVAAEEMGRHRGFWWAPDGLRVAVCRVDESKLPVWHLTDPSTPWSAPTSQRYPAAGGRNADVRLAVLSTDGARRVNVSWDRDRYPYLTRVSWDLAPDRRDRLIIQVQSRDQHALAILAVDAERGATTVLRERHADHPSELIDGVPCWSGWRLVTVEDRDEAGPQGTRALVVDDEVVTSTRMQVRRVVGVHDEQVVFTASDGDPTTVGVWAWSPGAGVACLAGGHAVNTATVARRWVVLSSATPERPVPQVRVVAGDASDEAVGDIEVLAEVPVVTPRPRWLSLGRRRLRAALLLPETADGSSDLPVVLDPYGGPHAQRVLATSTGFVASQWLADQGFAVLVVDGRGTPGRGPAWERAIHGQMADVVLADQLAALRAAARLEPRLDLDRVGIRGWSFGGYLAALAAIRAPRQIHAAVAGAPVADWRMYDTHYTERYLGHPVSRSAAYTESSLVDPNGDLVGRVEPRGRPRPRMLIIHGLADDNVFAAHSLRLSEALLRAGWDHQFLPLPRVSHMTPEVEITARLSQLQARFLQEALGVAHS